MQLTDNFSSSEFLVSSSFPHLTTRWEELSDNEQHHLFCLANRLQVLRDYYDKPIKITSGYRSSSLNEAVGGSPGSYHTVGMAADIVVIGITAPQVQSDWSNWSGGMGQYLGFTHLDLGPKRRWT